MLALARTNILALLLSITPIGGLEIAIAQSQQQEAAEDSEDQEGETERVKHDHSEVFYTKRYTGDNISDLEKELKAHPTSKGYVRLSDLFWDLGWDKNHTYIQDKHQILKSKTAAEKAIMLDPNSWEGYQNLGACLGDLGRFEEGIKKLEKAIQLSPQQLHSYYSIGLIEKKRGRYSSAISFFNKALQRDPAHARALGDIKEINEKLHIYK